MYPAYSGSVERYGLTTSADTDGAVTVHATTSDPAGVIRVDGRVAPGGTAQVSGLATGDEISVFIEDSAGSEVHSLVYLPAGFPALEVVASSPDVAPGQVGVTLNDFRGGPQAAATLDRNGVPTHVESVTGNAIDLKQQPNGNSSISTPTTTAGRTGSVVVEMDHRWQEVARHETVGLQDTDPHDSILLPDGSRWLIAYEPNGTTTNTDAVIQKVSSAGTVVFQWSSAALAGETVVPPGNADYAHINSIALAPDGDVVASFRHLSAVLKIATSAHDGFAVGDVVWKLGGRDSSFTFVDDPLGGPCAQHTASMLPDGHVLLFDDGSDEFLSSKLCVDQADPTGPAVDRFPWQSRVAEYALDTTAGTATLVWDYTPPGRYTWFMGSAERLANGDTLVGWAAAVQALASEVDADGNLLWEVRLAPTPEPHPEAQWSYRAALMNVPDAIAPQVSVAAPASGARYPVGAHVAADFACRDTGGSSLHVCAGDLNLKPGGLLDTSTPGPHTVRAVGTDGAGNTTTVTRSYTVTATYQPSWTDHRVRSVLKRARATTRLTVRNAGTYADTFSLRGARGSRRIGVRYKVGRTDVTDQVRAGTLRTPRLKPGESFVLRVVAVRTDRTRPRSHRSFQVTATSLANQSRDAVVVRVRARGR